MTTFALILGVGFLLVWFLVARPIVRAVERRLEQDGRS